MSSREFAEWAAFDRMEPGEPVRSDLQTALICKVYADLHRVKHASPHSLDDFLLHFKEEPKAKAIHQSTKEIKLKLLQWKQVHDQRERRRR